MRFLRRSPRLEQRVVSIVGYQAAVVGVLGAVIASEKLQEEVRRRMLDGERDNPEDDENDGNELSHSRGTDFLDERMEIIDYWPLTGPPVMKTVQVTVEDKKVAIGKDAIKS